MSVAIVSMLSVVSWPSHRPKPFAATCVARAAHLSAPAASRVRAASQQLCVALHGLLQTRSSPPDTELFRAIQAVARDVDPGARVVPRVIAGFTDAHWLRDLGIVVYGFVPRWLPPSESRGVHGLNERVSVDNLERGIETTVRILEELGRP